jgi:methylmalonyl-CoA mutase cobalamin-binding domain/chain
MSDELSRLIVELKRDESLNLVKTKIKDGEDAIRILEECRQGMSIVGDLYQKGDYFLAEMILSAEIFKEAVVILNPYLMESAPEKPLGKVVLATLKGDIHDLGKNIVATMLRAQGFEVIDLGVDVDPRKVIESVKETKPDFLGFSALITTAFKGMKEVAEMLEEAGLRDNLKLMVGGGVTSAMVKEYIGADFQALDAIQGVNYCLKTIGGER